MRRWALCLMLFAATPGCAVLPHRSPALAATPADAAPPPWPWPAEAPPEPPPPPSPPPAAARPATPSAPAAAVAFAEAQVGKPYCRGGEGPDCFDCSGLVQAAWAQAGVALPRTSEEQARSLETVSSDELQTGDVVWWPGHVGLYVGDGQIVDARGVRAGVVRRTLRAAPVRVLRPGGGKLAQASSILLSARGPPCPRRTASTSTPSTARASS